MTTNNINTHKKNGQTERQTDTEITRYIDSEMDIYIYN